MPNLPVQQEAEHIIADRLEEIMVGIARIPDRSPMLNITMGVLATLAGLLRANNLQGLRNLARVCNQELMLSRYR